MEEGGRGSSKSRVFVLDDTVCEGARGDGREKKGSEGRMMLEAEAEDRKAAKEQRQEQEGEPIFEFSKASSQLSEDGERGKGN